MPSLIRPFTALRPRPEHAAAVAAPPYDVLSSEEARVRAAGKPYSFLHISTAEIDLPEDIDHYAPEVYAKSAENLQKLIDQGILIREAKPCYYAYRLVMGNHVQTGLIAAASVADYDSNRIRKHEFTRPDKEDDRVRQIEALNAQTGPVLLAHPDSDEAEQLIAEVDGRAIGFVQIIDPALLDADGRCVFGATVEMEDQDSGNSVTYQIVGEDEADIKAGKISVNSPVARGLIGKYAGDLAQVQTPGGIREYEIIDVRYE